MCQICKVRIYAINECHGEPIAKLFRQITVGYHLEYVVNCKPLEIDEPYDGTYFRHVMSKAYQYGTNDIVVCARMTCVRLKDAHAPFQKTVTWTKKSGKDIIEWDKACVEVGLLSRKLKTPMKT